MARNYSVAGIALIAVAVVAGVAAGLAFNQVEKKGGQFEVQTSEGTGVVSTPASGANSEPRISVVSPTIPSDHIGRTACRVCHETGVAGAQKFRANHADRTDAQCPTCHRRG